MNNLKNKEISEILLFFARLAAIAILVTGLFWYASATAYVPIEVEDGPANTSEILDDYVPPKPEDRPALKENECNVVAKPIQEEKPRYSLTEDERILIEQVVMAEAGGEGYDGMRLVAQCILDGCEKNGWRPAELIRKYQYTGARKTPSDVCTEAVAAVFDKGDTYSSEKIEIFYAPAICRSSWHESQTFVLEYGGHRFFWMG